MRVNDPRRMPSRTYTPRCWFWLTPEKSRLTMSKGRPAEFSCRPPPPKVWFFSRSVVFWWKVG
jgi:hypothetical protein